MNPSVVLPPEGQAAALDKVLPQQILDVVAVQTVGLRKRIQRRHGGGFWSFANKWSLDDPRSGRGKIETCRLCYLSIHAAPLGRRRELHGLTVGSAPVGVRPGLLACN